MEKFKIAFLGFIAAFIIAMPLPSLACGGSGGTGSSACMCKAGTCGKTCGGSCGGSAAEKPAINPADYSVKLFKSPTCGCCTIYGDALKKAGFQVEMENNTASSMATIREKYNISPSKQSCHTSIIGDYFIEGHVPIEAVIKLLMEKPDIDGIGLPGMPIGTPGMPGPKSAPYKIYQLKDGVYSEFMTI